MKGFIETINGRYGGTTFALENGAVCNIGAELGNDLFFPNDYLLAPLHFTISNEDKILIKSVADSLFVNNELIKEAELKHGDFILAGGTLFYFSIEGEKTLSETPLGKLTSILNQLEKPCFLIDENLDKRILLLVRQTRSFSVILKDNIEKLDYIPSNPILVMPPKEHLETFIRTFWGLGRLIFLELRDTENGIFYLKNLLLKTQTENRNDLRFYDPRMLRVMLGEAEKKNAQFFFAGVKRYFVESQLPSHYFEFAWTESGVNAQMTRLTERTERIPTQKEIISCIEYGNLFGNFVDVAEKCLQTLLSSETINFRILVDKLTSKMESLKLDLSPEKIQFIALNALLGEAYADSQEFSDFFSTTNFANSDKLEFLVSRLNLKRG